MAKENAGGWKTCSRGHKYRGERCPICWKQRRSLFVVALGVSVLGCQRATPPAASSGPPVAVISATVFTDSTMHARYCVPVPPGQSWRQVCTPRDQSNIRIVPNEKP